MIESEVKEKGCRRSLLPPHAAPPLPRPHSSSAAVGVQVQLRNGRRLTTVASPLRGLSGLYEAVAPREDEGPIVSLEFQDISQENVQGSVGGREGGIVGGSERGVGKKITLTDRRRRV